MQLETEGCYPHPLPFVGSPTFIGILTPDRSRYIGQAERTGVTPPGFRDHPVYKLPAAVAEHYPLPPGSDPATRYFVFDGRSWYESEAWRAAERARQLMLPLLITACSGRKSKAGGDVPAWQRYDGPLYRMARKLRRAGRWPDADHLNWVILSARYGFLPADTLLPDYDQVMTADRAGAIRAGQGHTLTPYLTHARAILVDLGQVYRLALPPELPAQTAYTAGGIGQRVAQVKAWIEARR
jgi:hypothetical protein